jgi:predicted RND superfamily exporter protein
MRWFRQTIEIRFAGLGSWAFQQRLKALGIALLLCAASAAPLGSLRFESSMDSLFHPTDPARLALESFRESFGNDELFLILLHPPDLFDSAFLIRLQTIHRELEETVPYLADIDSLVSLFGVGRPARSTEGRAVSTMQSS